MLSKKPAIVYLTILASSGLIAVTFKRNTLAYLVSRGMLVIFFIWFLSQKDFKTRYPEAAKYRLQMIILTAVLIALTAYQYSSGQSLPK